MLQDLTQTVLSRALDATAMRHRAIANNLANVETPGYQRQDVSFEDQMRSVLSGDSPIGDGSAAEGVQPAFTEDKSQPARENGNNVDPDREVSRLADNTLRYEATMQALEMKYKMLNTAIHEGKG